MINAATWRLKILHELPLHVLWPCTPKIFIAGGAPLLSSVRPGDGTIWARKARHELQNKEA